MTSAPLDRCALVLMYYLCVITQTLRNATIRQSVLNFFRTIYSSKDVFLFFLLILVTAGTQS